VSSFQTSFVLNARQRLNVRLWIGLVLVTGLAVLIGSTWFAFSRTSAPESKLELPFSSTLLVGVVLLAVSSMLATGLAWLVNWIRGRRLELASPGMWAFAWIGLQLACFGAMAILGVVTLIAFAFGTDQGRPFLQAFIVVLVGSALLSVSGGSIRSVFRAAKCFQSAAD
jgi:hypothetical protein